MHEAAVEGRARPEPLRLAQGGLAPGAGAWGWRRLTCGKEGEPSWCQARRLLPPPGPCRAGELSPEELESIMTIVANPRAYKVPDWFLNRQKDVRDGRYSQARGAGRGVPAERSTGGAGKGEEEASLPPAPLGARGLLFLSVQR